MHQNYIGFADSEEFLKAIDPKRPVNLNVGDKSGKPDRRFGVCRHYSVLHMSQAQDNGEVLYFERITYEWNEVNGRPMLEDESKPHRLGMQVLEIAREHLVQCGLTVREALLALPANYEKMHGAATFLKWDKASECYQHQVSALPPGA